MKLFTSDNKNTVNIGNKGVWDALYLTAVTCLSEDDKDFLQFAMDFFKTGECVNDDAQITARQMELVKKRFLKVVPTDAAFEHVACYCDTLRSNRKNETVDSYANFFKTADGSDLLDEVIGLLKYADKSRVDVLVE